MESNGVSTFRHRKSLSTERFLGVFPQSIPENATGDSNLTGSDYELDEDEVLWTGGFYESNHRSIPPSFKANQNHHSMGFRRPENFGILAALPENEKNRTAKLGGCPILYRKTSISSSSSSSMKIPAISKPPQSHQERENSIPVLSRKYHQSAPVNVPVISKGRNCVFTEVDDQDGEYEILPPHEIVARGSARSPMTTFSILEGVGRTLKGKDLRQVRNAVWRKTGFLD